MSSPAHPSPRPAERRRAWFGVRVGLLVLGVAALTGACGQGAQAGQALAGAATPAASAQAAPAAPDPAAGIGPGEWLVGVDVEPGTYRSAGPVEDGDYCMWSRKDAAGVGPLDNILASDGSYDAGQMLVTIEPTDVVFRTKGCSPFELIG